LALFVTDVKNSNFAAAKLRIMFKAGFEESSATNMRAEYEPTAKTDTKVLNICPDDP
jgi:hypothetical protein